MKLCALGYCRQTMTECVPHSHELWEFCVNTEGSGTLTMGGREVPFTVGTVTCIPPHVTHFKTSAEGFRDYFFYTDEFLSAEGLRFDESRPLLLQDDSAGTLTGLIKAVFNLYYRKKPEEKGIVLALFRDLMQLLAVRAAVRTPQPLVEQIKERITENFADPNLDLPQILRSTPYTENYIRKLFKDETGLTPTEFLTHLRMDYARHLLEQKQAMNLSVARVAELCGYVDERYFSRVFRAQEGVSPREYALRRSLSAAGEDLERLTYREEPQ
ncbi:MAG: helix-turn-helix domain-containing protein [Clostridia bacterium]|nr:helix-turn-helix domain-containing protein [Clostridia bacterium]